jgi:hypothetical protein
MAKVTSLLNLRGTIGDLTIRQTEWGMVAQSRPGPSREKVLTDKNFKATRRNACEFKLAAKDSKLLRRALDKTLDSVRDSRLNGIMNGLMRKASMQDEYSGYGHRCAAHGNISLLEGFDFNQKLLLNQALPVSFEHGLDVTTGTAKLVLPSFIARRKKGFPKGATHIQIVSCAAIVDFGRDGYANNIKSSELLPLSKKTPGTICLEHQLKVEAGEVLLQVMGIEFYKVENGKEVLLKGGAVRILGVARMPIAEIEGKHEPREAGKGDELKEGRGKCRKAEPFTAKELQETVGAHIKQLVMRDVAPDQSEGTS